MEPSLLNGLPVPLIEIKEDIKDMDDCIIEKKFKLSHEEIVNNWDKRIRRQIATKLAVCENEKVCEDVLKDYLRLLKEQAKNFKDKRRLREKISCHLKVLHLLCFTTRDNIGLYLVNYLDYMENILIFLSNLELEVIRHLKKNHAMKEYNKTILRVARRLIDNLSINLLNEEKRIFHVILKLDIKYEQSWKDVMQIVYRHYLINLPTRDRSDLSFCRIYALFQLWKQITDKNQHEVMDKIMYLKFNKTAECVNNNPLLRSILKPPSGSLVDLIDGLRRPPQVTIYAYFKYIEGQYEEDEINVSQSIELDSDDDDEITQQILFQPSETEEQRNGVIKAENRNITSVQENSRYVEIASNDGQVVCLIDDDDSDIEEVCVEGPKSIPRRKQVHKPIPPRPMVSFLDSIHLPDDCASSPTHTSSATETETPPAPPAEITPLPIVTAYIESVRRKGASVVSDTAETSTLAMESLSIRDVQKEVASLPDVLDTASSIDNIKNATSISNKMDTDHSSSNISDFIPPSVPLVSKEVQRANETEKCNCCCKHSQNSNSDTSSTNNNNNKSDSVKSVIKPNFKTVEIQTDNMDSFNYLCGMITPPSDRTGDENSPSSMDNIGSDSEMHNNNTLHSGNTNVYAYVPNIRPTASYVENSSHNRYESETHRFLGVCESSTQVCNFDQPQEPQTQNSILEESLKENIPEQDSNLIPLQNNFLTEISQPNQPLIENNLNSTEISQLNQEKVALIENNPNFAEISQPNQENVTLIENDLNLTEVSQPNQENVVVMEEPISETKISQEFVEEIQLNELENVVEQGNQNELALHELGIENQASEVQQGEEQLYDGTPDEGGNQNEPESEFNESFIEDSNDMHLQIDADVDGTDLVSEIELHEEELSEVLPDEEPPENGNEQDQQLEQYQDTFETNSVEMENLIIFNKECPTTKQIEENSASNETEIVTNQINNTSHFSNITNLPIIIANSQGTDLQESVIDIIPYDYISALVLREDYSTDKEIVLVPAIDEDCGQPTKYTVIKIATELAQNALENTDSESAEEVLKSIEPCTVKDTSACKIQASVTMAQLENTTTKEGKNVKITEKKVEDNGEKIIYTSNERVKSAPLSLFAKFEQLQSDLIENAFCGPIEPINNKTNINCDNSNDNFCFLDSDRSVITEDFVDNNHSFSSQADSPISPPYENIHAQEYENHILNVNMETSPKQTNSIKKPVPPTNIDRIEKKKFPKITETKINSSTFSTVVTERKEEKRLDYATLFQIGAPKEDKKLNSNSFPKITEINDHKKRDPATFLKIPQHKKRPKDQKPKYKLTPIQFPEEDELANKQHRYVSKTPKLTPIISQKGTSKRKSNNSGGPANKKVNFGTTEVRLIPRIKNKNAELLNTDSTQTLLSQGEYTSQPTLSPDPSVNEDRSSTIPRLGGYPASREDELLRKQGSLNQHRIEEGLLDRLRLLKGSELDPLRSNTLSIEDELLQQQRLLDERLLQHLRLLNGGELDPSVSEHGLSTIPRLGGNPSSRENELLKRQRSLDKHKSDEEGLLRKLRLLNRELGDPDFLQAILSRDSMKEYGIWDNDLDCLEKRPRILIVDDTKVKKQRLYVNYLMETKEKKVKSENSSSCIMTRVDYDKPIRDNQFQNTRITNLDTPSCSYSTGCSVPSAIAKRIDTPTFSNVLPPSTYIPASNSSLPVHELQHSVDKLMAKSSSNTPQPVHNNNAQSRNLTKNEFNQCQPEIINLTKPKSNTSSAIGTPELEFSSSPIRVQIPDQIDQLLEGSINDSSFSMNDNISFLSNNSNFYTTTANEPTLKSPEDRATEFQACIYDQTQIYELICENLKNVESGLPFKKRRMHEILSSKSETRIPPVKDEISYPGTPMMSIAEIEALQQNQNNQNRSFKTPAERKEMPPLPSVYYSINSADPSPIITDQFNINNHTYNNPTINYHMSNVPVPFINVPCASYYPIILPFNNIHHPFEPTGVHQNLPPYNNDTLQYQLNKPVKKEKKKRPKKEKHCTEHYYPDYKTSDSKII